MVIASTPAVQVVLEMGRTRVPQSSDPFSSGQVVGDGWGIASPKPDSDINLPQIPSHINNNMTVFKISLFTSIQSLFTPVFLPFFGGALSYPTPRWFRIPPTSSAAPPLEAAPAPPPCFAAGGRRERPRENGSARSPGAAATPLGAP